MPLTRAQAPGGPNQSPDAAAAEAAPVRLESKHQGQKINSSSLQCKRTEGEEGTGAWGQKSALRTCSAALSRNSGAYNKERQRAGDVADASLGNAADERIGQTVCVCVHVSRLSVSLFVRTHRPHSRLAHGSTHGQPPRMLPPPSRARLTPPQLFRLLHCTPCARERWTRRSWLLRLQADRPSIQAGKAAQAGPPWRPRARPNRHVSRT